MGLVPDEMDKVWGWHIQIKQSTGIYSGNLLLCLDAWHHEQEEIKLASTFWDERAPLIKQAEISNDS